MYIAQWTNEITRILYPSPRLPELSAMGNVFLRKTKEQKALEPYTKTQGYSLELKARYNSS